VCNIHLTLTDLNDAVWQQQWSPASSDFKVNKQMLLASIEEETKRDLAKAEKYHSKQTYDKATKVTCEFNLPKSFTAESFIASNLQLPGASPCRPAEIAGGADCSSRENR